MTKKRTSLEAVLGEDPSVVEPESTRQDGPPNNLAKTSGKRSGNQATNRLPRFAGL